MLQMSLSQARAKLSQLVRAAETGDEVVITRNGKPAVRLVPVSRTNFRIGMLRGVIGPASIPDFFEPLTAEELADWGA